MPKFRNNNFITYSPPSFFFNNNSDVEWSLQDSGIAPLMYLCRYVPKLAIIELGLLGLVAGNLVSSQHVEICKLLNLASVVINKITKIGKASQELAACLLHPMEFVLLERTVVIEKQFSQLLISFYDSRIPGILLLPLPDKKHEHFPS